VIMGEQTYMHNWITKVDFQSCLMDKNLLFTSFNSHIYDLFFRENNRLGNGLCERYSVDVIN